MAGSPIMLFETSGRPVRGLYHQPNSCRGRRRGSDRAFEISEAPEAAGGGYSRMWKRCPSTRRSRHRHPPRKHLRPRRITASFPERGDKGRYESHRRDQADQPARLAMASIGHTRGFRSLAPRRSARRRLRLIEDLVLDQCQRARAECQAPGIRALWLTDRISGSFGVDLGLHGEHVASIPHIWIAEAGMTSRHDIPRFIVGLARRHDEDLNASDPQITGRQEDRGYPRDPTGARNVIRPDLRNFSLWKSVLSGGLCPFPSSTLPGW